MKSAQGPLMTMTFAAVPTATAATTASMATMLRQLRPICYSNNFIIDCTLNQTSQCTLIVIMFLSNNYAERQWVRVGITMVMIPLQSNVYASS